VLPLLDSLSNLLAEPSAHAPSPRPSKAAVGVVLAAHGYPGDVRTGDVIHGLDDVARDCPDVTVFFAGVKQRGEDLVTSGGRVMTVMATAPSFAIAIARAYEAASKIRFDGVQYRRDIGRKAIG
jgi:phosphoribosylamine--glycine ligase